MTQSQKGLTVNVIGVLRRKGENKKTEFEEIIANNFLSLFKD